MLQRVGESDVAVNSIVGYRAELACSASGGLSGPRSGDPMVAKKEFSIAIQGNTTFATPTRRAGRRSGTADRQR
jgi:hypothetical protein